MLQASHNATGWWSCSKCMVRYYCDGPDDWLQSEFERHWKEHKCPLGVKLSASIAEGGLLKELITSGFASADLASIT